MSDVNMAPGELREIRRELGMNQASLAGWLGLTGNFIGMMERGEKAIERRTALAVRYLADHPEVWEDVNPGDVQPRDPAHNLKRLSDFPKRYLFDGKEWGAWRFSASSMTLDYLSRMANIGTKSEPQWERRERYYVELARMGNAAQVVEWIDHLNDKTWCTGAVMGNFVEAIAELLPLSGYAHDGDDLSREEIAEAIRRKMEAPPEGYVHNSNVSTLDDDDEE